MYSKHRLEALSDGIFAIAMTLLVLNLVPPPGPPQVTLHAFLASDTHAWVSFVLSFAIAAIFWVLQHKLFDLLEGINGWTIIPTFIFLGLISLVPFSTSMLGHYLGDKTAFLIYFGNMLAAAIVLTIKLEVARLHGHLRPGPESKIMRLRLYIMMLVMGGTMVGIMFLPVTRIWIVTLLLGVSAKFIRRAHAHRLAKNSA